MDDIVHRALARWPNVPDVYGWLTLDARGHWWIRDARLDHPATLAFIARNYQPDAQGAWFFQNGHGYLPASGRRRSWPDSPPGCRPAPILPCCRTKHG